MPALGLVAVSVAVLGMGFGMMVQARYGQLRAEERPAVTVSAAPAVTASAAATVTASVVPALMVNVAPAVTASAAPAVTASAAPARTAAKPQPPVKRSPELVDPFRDKAAKVARPKLPFDRPEF